MEPEELKPDLMQSRLHFFTESVQKFTKQFL